MTTDGTVAALLASSGLVLASIASLVALFLLGLLVAGPVTKSLGSKSRTFYGEDARHAIKENRGYHGFRLVLEFDQTAIRTRILEILKKEGARSMLRIRFLSPHQYAFTTESDAAVASELLQVRTSGIDEPVEQAALASELWRRRLPLQIFLDGKRLDLMAHHAVFDGVRGVRLLNDLLGNLGCKGAIRPHELPCCLLACSLSKLARVLLRERPRGSLGAMANAAGASHESHYLRVPTALVKRAKETHGLGFAATLQGLLLHALFRSGGVSTSELHVACTVGFSSDRWAKLGSAFNHYGAFPLVARGAATPQQVAKQLTRGTRRNGTISGLPCLLGNASCGGMSGMGSMIKSMYEAIDVLIGGGPLIMEPRCGYRSYHLYKFVHTVPVYIFYATICDVVDISIQSRVPLPDLQRAFDEAVALLKEPALPEGPASPRGVESRRFTSEGLPTVDLTPAATDVAAKDE